MALAAFAGPALSLSIGMAQWTVLRDHVARWLAGSSYRCQVARSLDPVLGDHAAVVGFARQRQGWRYGRR